jgi:hypothetical protein
MYSDAITNRDMENECKWHGIRPSDSVRSGRQSRRNVSGSSRQGFWNEASQTITFDVPTTSPEGKQAFTLFNGCLFRTPANPTPNQDVVATLTGFAEVTTPIFLPANSRRTVFGWFAQISEIL